MRWSHGAVVVLLVLFWTAMRLGGDGFSARRPFVWALFMLADLHAAVMVSIFWTSADDVVISGEADRLYGAIGLGGILGGAADGALVGLLAHAIGPGDLLRIGAVLVACGGLLASVYEATYRPAKRVPVPSYASTIGITVVGQASVPAECAQAGTEACPTTCSPGQRWLTPMTRPLPAISVNLRNCSSGAEPLCLPSARRPP